MPTTTPNTTLILFHTTARRLIRVGNTPVLEMVVTHPVLSFADSGADSPDSPQASAAERFNRAYSAMAEAFLTFCAGKPAACAGEAFAAGGRGAAYTFDRRTITCRMEAVVSSAEDSDTDMASVDAPEAAEFVLPTDGILTVHRTVRTGSRRGSVPDLAVHTSRDRWRASDLTLLEGGTSARKKRRNR